MKNILVTFLLLVGMGSVASADVGRIEEPIINGSPADRGEYPFMVSLAIGRVGIDLRRAQLEAESFQPALFRYARWVPRSTMVHVSAGPPAIPDSGMSPVRC
jgi:hypothetical protein